ncbi:protein kinase domain-containing protein [Endozoicomonas ascidiicola]|uniref:protein kinase domain-containing protein n=1 Tax=Endozoicomonas ascidiicola TaxID=1698521 RepID=UPI000AA41D66|nr:serine/threonine-protein kinase [Endozoicomonas ascidiicola]
MNRISNHNSDSSRLLEPQNGLKNVGQEGKKNKKRLRDATDQDLATELRPLKDFKLTAVINKSVKNNGESEVVFDQSLVKAKLPQVLSPEVKACIETVSRVIKDNDDKQAVWVNKNKSKLLDELFKNISGYLKNDSFDKEQFMGALAEIIVEQNMFKKSGFFAICFVDFYKTLTKRMQGVDTMKYLGGILVGSLELNNDLCFYLFSINNVFLNKDQDWKKKISQLFDSNPELVNKLNVALNFLVARRLSSYILENEKVREEKKEDRYLSSAKGLSACFNIVDGLIKGFARYKEVEVLSCREIILAIVSDIGQSKVDVSSKSVSRALQNFFDYIDLNRNKLKTTNGSFCYLKEQVLFISLFFGINSEDGSDLYKELIGDIEKLLKINRETNGFRSRLGIEGNSQALEKMTKVLIESIVGVGHRESWKCMGFWELLLSGVGSIQFDKNLCFETYLDSEEKYFRNICDLNQLDIDRERLKSFFSLYFLVKKSSYPSESLACLIFKIIKNHVEENESVQVTGYYWAELMIQSLNVIHDSKERWDYFERLNIDPDVFSKVAFFANRIPLEKSTSDRYRYIPDPEHTLFQIMSGSRKKLSDCKIGLFGVLGNLLCFMQAGLTGNKSAKYFDRIIREYEKGIDLGKKRFSDHLSLYKNRDSVGTVVKTRKGAEWIVSLVADQIKDVKDYEPWEELVDYHYRVSRQPSGDRSSTNPTNESGEITVPVNYPEVDLDKLFRDVNRTLGNADDIFPNSKTPRGYLGQSSAKDKYEYLQRLWKENKNTAGLARKFAEIALGAIQKKYNGYLKSLMDQGILDSTYYFSENIPVVGSRLMVVVNIDGVKFSFYRSKYGTDGKEKGKWYPFFGINNDTGWIVKMLNPYKQGDLHTGMEKMQYILNRFMDWHPDWDDSDAEGNAHPILKNAGMRLGADRLAINLMVYGVADISLQQENYTDVKNWISCQMSRVALTHKDEETSLDKIIIEINGVREDQDSINNMICVLYSLMQKCCSIKSDYTAELSRLSRFDDLHRCLMPINKPLAENGNVLEDSMFSTHVQSYDWSRIFNEWNKVLNLALSTPKSAIVKATGKPDSDSSCVLYKFPIRDFVVKNFSSKEETNFHKESRLLEAMNRLTVKHEKLVLMPNLGVPMFQFIDSSDSVNFAIIKSIVYQALVEMKMMQEINIVHGDIKHANMALSPFDGVLSLLDFDSSYETDKPVTSFTYTNGYLSPEEVTLKASITSRDLIKNDIYALGLTALSLFYRTRISGISKESDIQEVKDSDDFNQRRLTDLSKKYGDFTDSKGTSFLKLLRCMLEPDAAHRISLEDALEDPCFTENNLTDAEIGVRITHALKKLRKNDAKDNKNRFVYQAGLNFCASALRLSDVSRKAVEQFKTGSSIGPLHRNSILAACKEQFSHLVPLVQGVFSSIHADGYTPFEFIHDKRYQKFLAGSRMIISLKELADSTLNYDTDMADVSTIKEFDVIVNTCLGTSFLPFLDYVKRVNTNLKPSDSYQKNELLESCKKQISLSVGDMGSEIMCGLIEWRIRFENTGADIGDREFNEALTRSVQKLCDNGLLAVGNAMIQLFESVSSVEVVSGVREEQNLPTSPEGETSAVDDGVVSRLPFDSITLSEDVAGVVSQAECLQTNQKLKNEIINMNRLRLGALSETVSHSGTVNPPYLEGVDEYDILNFLRIHCPSFDKSSKIETFELCSVSLPHHKISILDQFIVDGRNFFILKVTSKESGMLAYMPGFLKNSAPPHYCVVYKSISHSVFRILPAFICDSATDMSKTTKFFLSFCENSLTLPFDVQKFLFDRLSYCKGRLMPMRAHSLESLKGIVPTLTPAEFNSFISNRSSSGKWLAGNILNLTERPDHTMVADTDSLQVFNSQHEPDFGCLVDSFEGVVTGVDGVTKKVLFEKFLSKGKQSYYIFVRTVDDRKVSIASIQWADEREAFNYSDKTVIQADSLLNPLHEYRGAGDLLAPGMHIDSVSSETVDTWHFMKQSSIILNYYKAKGEFLPA